jgi:hypothetical protein
MGIRPIAEILAAREDGIDCTEDESAELKRYMREHPNDSTSARISSLFPVEGGEVMSTMPGPIPYDWWPNDAGYNRSEKAPSLPPKEAPFNEEQELIDYLETRYDQDPRYNDPSDPNDYEDFEPEYEDGDLEVETE